MDDIDLRRYVRWMRLRNLSDNTVRCRRIVLSGLGRQLGKPLREATAEDLDGWQRSLTVAAASRHTYLAFARSFYAWAAREGLVVEDPSALLVLPVLPKRLPRPITDDDLVLALRAAPDRVRVWLLLAALAGLRAGEVAAVERGDVHDELGRPVLLIRGKGARERTVPLSGPLLAALRPHLNGAAGRLFLRADRAGPISADAVSTACNRHLHDLGIPATLHQLRHWFGTNVYRESGRDALLTRDLLGHSSVTTTAVYAAWDGESAAPVIAALARKAL